MQHPWRAACCTAAASLGGCSEGTGCHVSAMEWDGAELLLGLDCNPPGVPQSWLRCGNGARETRRLPPGTGMVRSSFCLQHTVPIQRSCRDGPCVNSPGTALNEAFFPAARPRMGFPGSPPCCGFPLRFLPLMGWGLRIPRCCSVQGWGFLLPTRATLCCDAPGTDTALGTSSPVPPWHGVPTRVLCVPCHPPAMPPCHRSSYSQSPSLTDPWASPSQPM